MDAELRLVDPAKNQFRFFGIEECRTLFGELCLRIRWGRIGNKRMRERSETFDDPRALERRRAELLARRRRHGYVSRRRVDELGTRAATPTPSPAESADAFARAVDRNVVAQHGLPVDDATARELVAHWHASTLALVRFIQDRGADVVDLVDASALAALFVDACAA